MELKIRVLDNIVIDNQNGKFAGIEAIDLKGKNVTFEDNAYKTNNSLSSVTNGYIMNTGITNMFNSSFLTNIDVSFPNAINGASAFCSGSRLQTVNIDCPNVTNASYMFKGSSKLESANVSIPQATLASYLFCGCTALQTVSANLSSFSATATTLRYIFNKDTALTDVQLIVQNALSAKTAANFGISGCPATAYTYTDIIDDNCVRKTFTSTERPTYKTLTFTSDSEVSYTKEDDTDNNTSTITF